MDPKDLDKRVAKAVRRFWRTRNAQRKKQATGGKVQDAGLRSAATGGAQMDGFAELVRDLLIDAGVPKDAIFARKPVELPGYYRPTKKWDLLVVEDGVLVATMEFKSQVGPSFGNNFNNRTEEAIGSATDILAAFREGAFSPSSKPWLGYLMLLEDAKGSSKPVSVSEPHFPVFEEFRGASYRDRYQLFCLRLIRERLYDAAAFLTTPKKGGPGGKYMEPSEELAMRRFVGSLLGHVESLEKS